MFSAIDFPSENGSSALTIDPYPRKTERNGIEAAVSVRRKTLDLVVISKEPRYVNERQLGRVVM